MAGFGKKGKVCPENDYASNLEITLTEFGGTDLENYTTPFRRT